MSSKDIKNGKWFDVQNAEQHQNLKRCGSLEYREFFVSRVQMGTYTGPGRYLVLSYQQRCPRNCCYDSVHEVIAACDVIQTAQEEIRELVDVIKTARGRST